MTPASTVDWVQTFGRLYVEGEFLKRGVPDAVVLEALEAYKLEVANGGLPRGRGPDGRLARSAWLRLANLWEGDNT